MSLFRQWFPERGPVEPEASSKIRGLKGFAPNSGLLQDPLYTDDPTFWILGGAVAQAGVGNFGKVGVELPADRSLLVIVDGLLVGSDVGASFSLEATQGEGLARVAVTTDTQVYIRNRREQGPNAAFNQRCGLLRILDATALTGGAFVPGLRVVANTLLYVPLQHRLYQGEQFWVRENNGNVLVSAVLWGRLMSRRG